MGIRSRLGRTACSTVLPQTMLNLEVDIFTELLGVMERMNLLCLVKDMLTGLLWEPPVVEIRNLLQ